MISRLLENENRPIPAMPTHFLLVDILNRDLSIKRVTIYFNPSDSWTIEECSSLDDLENIAKHIESNLQFLGYDNSTLAYRAYLIEVSTQSIVKKFSIKTYEPIN
ncbi:hypothetical protein [Sphingobacterium cavernae]|uniref:hypothetical protein n=1 Tax=Sphingobacterium cavernae TaxID=2592657 RepID=UPI00122FFF43|nr:hypothetical protein [Sphingobacterium cavernae]